MPNFSIQTTDLSKTYREWWRKTTALDGVSIEVEQGSIFGLLGPNGAGKSTLVKILLSIVRPSRGFAIVLGGDPRDPSVRERIGFLPEHLRLPDYLRAKSFLSHMGRLNGVSRARLKEKIPELMERVGLAGEKKKLGAYSKGMRQRLGIAAALINEPTLLFLDEPTEGLDPIGRKDIRDLLVEQRDRGRTIFLNSHILSEVEQVCDKVLVLHKGQVVSGGTPAEYMKDTGEYKLMLADISTAVRACVDEAVPENRWEGNSLYVRPNGLAGLNQLIDKLRALPVEFESIEPVRSSLEQYFIEVVGGRGKTADGDAGAGDGIETIQGDADGGGATDA